MQQINVSGTLWIGIRPFFEIKGKQSDLRPPCYLVEDNYYIEWRRHVFDALMMASVH